MTKTTIITALRLILSLALAGPAQAWPGLDCAWGSEPTECDALAVALVREAAPAHPHIRKMTHATIPRPPSTRLPEREEDPLASMHFE
jgi:hypothetical protein